MCARNRHRTHEEYQGDDRRGQHQDEHELEPRPTGKTEGHSVYERLALHPNPANAGSEWCKGTNRLWKRVTSCNTRPEPLDSSRQRRNSLGIMKSAYHGCRWFD